MLSSFLFKNSINSANIVVIWSMAGNKTAKILKLRNIQSEFLFCGILADTAKWALQLVRTSGAELKALCVRLTNILETDSEVNHILIFNGSNFESLKK